MGEKETKKMYESLNSFNILYDEKIVRYKEEKYKENDFLRRASHFRFIDDETVESTFFKKNELPSTIYKIFLRNTSKMSILGLFFPCALFLSSSVK